MKLFRIPTKLMSMNEDVWLRHANPWSGWSRILTYPFFLAAFWSRKWLGIYFLIPVVIVSLWVWLNPRIFPKPISTDNWISKGVFGEKIFVEHMKMGVEIPPHHLTAGYITTLIALAGLILLVYGLVMLEIWPSLFVASLAFLGKIWFVDRMVWLFEDMKHLPQFKKLLY